MLKPCSTAHVLSALLSQNAAVLPTVPLGTVPGSQLSLICASPGLLTLVSAKEPATSEAVPQPCESIRVQARSPLRQRVQP